MSDYEVWRNEAISRPFDFNQNHQFDEATFQEIAHAKNDDTRMRDVSSVHEQLPSRPAAQFKPAAQEIQSPYKPSRQSKQDDTRCKDDNSQNASLAFRSYKERPDQPDAAYSLRVTWEIFLRNVAQTEKVQAKEVAKNFLREVCTTYGVYIKFPTLKSSKISIWGTEEQCKTVRDVLEAWESKVRAIRKKEGSLHWARSTAYDGRKEDRGRQLMFETLEDRAIQDVNDHHLGFEAYLIWPQSYDLDTYLQKYDSTALIEIAKEFRCRFQHSTTTYPRYTRVQAFTEHNLLSAYQRLINLVKEMVTQTQLGGKSAFCRPPSQLQSYKLVRLQEVASTNPKIYRPSLLDDCAIDQPPVNWTDVIAAQEKENQAEIRASLGRFLTALSASGTHVRLRVDFGEILIGNMPRGSNKSGDYKFNEFAKLIQDRRTILEDPALDPPSSGLADFRDKLSILPDLHALPPSYQQVFEFTGTTDTRRLRLQIDLEPGYVDDEVQITSKKWLTSRDVRQNNSMLTLKVLDFEKPSYMIQAQAWQLFSYDSINKDLEAFEASIDCKLAPRDVSGRPADTSLRLKSTFPGHEQLIAVTESHSIRFRFKDTDGVLEVQKEEIYAREGECIQQIPSDVKFNLNYYYPEWDNLLGEFASAKPGDDISWHRDLDIFFPSIVNPDYPRALPKGFGKFMEEIDEVQKILKGVLSSPGAESNEMYD